MREIKFRAWHPGEKKMRYGVGTDGYGGIVLDTEYMGLKPLKGEAILMQWTGLKDKQGKEIYEGDIVYYDYDYGGFKHWEVKWAYDNWAMVRGERYTGDMNASDDPEYNNWESSEVIGNIYENPELLKGIQ